ncbi:hypothetical protein [Acetobacter pasteurianus]|uniref:Uncharacterized protein n=1 Tax=Acetobacter pasteurianus subsp. pasteurianus TaxID=481145 RepID=A0A1Y0XYU4_ACEPA|nr:hypothetical protein [Acetobacter pasteurianus]ARW48103.1 hypothetical protein S1001342_01780 [Acetobacter pasteurianus subsp. pasteurianus]
MTNPLPIVGYINPLVADALRDPTSGINTTQLRAEPNEAVSGAVVMKADADAVIARLQEALRGIIDTAHNLPEFMRIEAMQKEAELALKGPEA